MDIERLGHRRAGDIGVQNADLAATLLHRHGQHRRHSALPDATLAGYDGDDFFHIGMGIGLRQQALRLLRTAAV